MDRTCDPCRVKPSERQIMRGLTNENSTQERQKVALICTGLHRIYTDSLTVVSAKPEQSTSADDA